MKKIRKTITAVILFIIIGMVAAYGYEKIFVVPKLNVELANLSTSTLTGSAKVTSEAKLSNSSVSDLGIKLLLTGDAVTYTFDIKNVGSKDAIISNFIKSTPTCTGVDTDSTKATSDSKIVCDALTYTLQYTDSKEDIKANDIIKSGETKNVTLTISYTGDSLPDNGVNISNINFNMTFKAN
jgi:hypothetical protein